MGQAVAERTVLRRQPDGTFETWGDVAHRVAVGNSMLTGDVSDYALMKHHLGQATLLMSGRHLQHGDETQPQRNQEVYTNCSTAACTFALFLLLLNGSGVGRCYDDDMMQVDWEYAPALRVVLSDSHPDFDWAKHESLREARHKYRGAIWHVVEDSREGWAKAVELWETLAFEKIHRDKLLVLDFSRVRPRGAPIAGMQNRPASGPAPLMDAFLKANTVRGAGLEPWQQTMYIDHYFAECVLVGGARRAARMATKFWRDRSVLEFIHVKRPVEYEGLTMDEIAALPFKPSSFLWSSNNSVAVDAEFWALLEQPADSSADAAHAHRVWKALTEASYGDGTGEPGIINVDKLERNDEGLIEDGDFIGSRKYQVSRETRRYLAKLAKRASQKTYNVIVNPCGEIVLNLLGAYCVIADVVPYHAPNLDEAEEAFRVATRALIRVNLMDCLYGRETRRTNRIGVGMTGVHEFAWKFFWVGFRDLINPDFDGIDQHDPRVRAACFWRTIARFREAVKDEAITYSRELGVAIPHTAFTIKPAGTTSKLFGLTEGWHLPPMREYLRWVQFREDDPLIATYEAAGYPIRKLKTYTGTVIVGFPTQPAICRLGMGEALVTAGEATPEEQYRWLQLGERFWIGDDGMGNQISYTLKYDPKVVGFDQFESMMRAYQPTIRCCSVMPQVDMAAYEYQPEERISELEYARLVQQIERKAEDVDREHVDCSTGACPIDFRKTA
jgi:adenosylcobalamin-dependent ribonucleoside-triphosphate reductase